VSLLVALVLPLLPSCSGDKAGGGFQMPPTPVEVATATPQIVRDNFQALGSLESDQLIQVVSEVNGIVESLPFREGQPMRKGDLIAQIEASEIIAQAHRAEAQRDREELAHKRAKRLFETNAISEQELDDARTSLRVAEADLALAQARLGKTRIRAPFSGLVGRRRISPGAYVSSGDLITELAHVATMRVTFSAPERFVGQLKAGIAVEISTPAYPNETFSGKLTVVDPIVDPTTRTVQLVAHVPNRNGLLRPGMSADVIVTLSERAQALVVPDEAVFAQGDQTFVYVMAADSSVQLTPIRLGTRAAAHVEVLSGLEPGATVIRAGHQKLYPGAKVMPVPAAGAATDTASDGTEGAAETDGDTSSNETGGESGA
jgi:membrane fusion protein (multidrug efflux system)